MKPFNAARDITLIIIAFMAISFSFVSASDRDFLSDYKQVRYDIENGLLSNEANDVIQTVDGHI